MNGSRAKADIERAMKENIARHRQEDEDRRQLRGKFAPSVGVCRVCSGRVVADIEFPWDGRIGGPPSAGHVAGWHCEGCFLVYRQCPQEKP
jgi:hypothetical protein